MDKRTTLATKETFLEVLTDCKKNNEKVFILADETGIVRIEGFISEIIKDAEEPFIILGDERQVILKEIIAVNGLFDPSYSEC